MCTAALHTLHAPPTCGVRVLCVCNAPAVRLHCHQARFGRSVLSARLTKDTKFDVTKRSMQTNLASRDAAGTTVYARYNVQLESDAVAAEVAAQMRACLPSE